MKQISLICAFSLLTVLPAHAQDDEGQSLMERGAELFLEGLRKEMEPAIDDLMSMAEQFGPAMQSFLQEMGPALADMAEQVQDWSKYEAPEILPNGDIIIRRKPDHPAPEPDAAPEDPQGEIDI